MKKRGIEKNAVFIGRDGSRRLVLEHCNGFGYGYGYGRFDEIVQYKNLTTGEVKVILARSFAAWAIQREWNNEETD